MGGLWRTWLDGGLIRLKMGRMEVTRAMWLDSSSLMIVFTFLYDV